jgi:CRP-like cAMP-binding protein
MMAQPNLARTFAWRGRRDKAILRAWIANIGQRNAIARTAHLISELSVRLAQAGMVHNGRFEIPLTQEDLGDTLGITSVHMNRTLMELRARWLLDLRSKRAYLHDEAGIKRTGNFDGAYLSPA